MVGMFVRHATLDDLDALASVEAACFPPKEAADIESLANRIERFPQHFWLLVNPDSSAGDTCFPARLEDGMLVSFINGMTTDKRDLHDDMYSCADMHDERGAWQMLFGVETAPVYQHRGCAAYLMRRVILDTAIAHRSGIVLTCKERLVGFYESFGGPSDQRHSCSFRSRIAMTPPWSVTVAYRVNSVDISSTHESNACHAENAQY